MEQLYKLALAEKIHVPSALRTLRIATGYKCEFCNHHQNAVHDWSFGTYACWDCIQSTSKNLSKAWNTKWVRYRYNVKYDKVFHHPRNAVSRLYGRKYYVWAQHREVAGERIGPIIAWEDIDGMVNAMKDAGSEDECTQRMNEYITQTLSAPSHEVYAEFTSAFVGSPKS
jgi:hypothetical protein